MCIKKSVEKNDFVFGNIVEGNSNHGNLELPKKIISYTSYSRRSPRPSIGISNIFIFWE